MAIQLLKDRCTGCRLCLKVCLFNAIDADGKRININEKCTACNQCISACPFDAIIQTESGETVDLSAYKHIWVFAEQRNGKLMNVALELIGEGHRLAREISVDTKVYALLIGDGIGHLVQDCYEYGADGVYLIEDKLSVNVPIPTPCMYRVLYLAPPEL